MRKGWLRSGPWLLSSPPFHEVQCGGERAGAVQTRMTPSLRAEQSA